MKRLSIAAMTLLAGCVQQQQPVTNLIPRPAPDDPTPSGIAYLCDGRKEVSVVYAKNRASVTLDGKTWRMEYQPTGRASATWTRPTNGRAATISRPCANEAAPAGRSPSTAGRCGGRRDCHDTGHFSQNLIA